MVLRFIIIIFKYDWTFWSHITSFLILGMLHHFVLTVTPRV